MHEAYTPTVFTRHNRPLRGILIDQQPWFAAHDFARLLGIHHPQSLAQRLDDHERRSVVFCYDSGVEEWVEVINESGLYRSLFRFGHPENRLISRWLGQEVIPLLRDLERPDDGCPRRLCMRWERQRVMVLDWQGELWVPLDSLPQFSPLAPGMRWR